MLRVAWWAGALAGEAPPLLGLTLLALAIRWPNLQMIPAFSDEVDEIYRSLLVAQGKLVALTNVDGYNGSLWNYLVAGALFATGDSLAAPRALALVFGLLTVAATYLLGRAWGGRSGALLAAA